MTIGISLVTAVLGFIAGFMTCHAFKKHEPPEVSEKEAQREKELDQEWSELFKFNGKEV